MKARNLTISLLVSCSIMAFVLQMLLLGYASAKEHEIVEIEIETSSQGSYVYVSAYALADLAKKKHPWLRFKPAEIQATEVLSTWLNRPRSKETLLGYMGDAMVLQAARGEIKGLEGRKNEDIRYLACASNAHIVFVTLDPSIKTFADFAGKRVAVGRRIEGVIVAVSCVHSVEPRSSPPFVLEEPS